MKSPADTERDLQLRRRDLLAGSIAVAAVGFGLDALIPAANAQTAAAPKPGIRPLDARAEARKIAFDRIGKGKKIFMISGFPQTRRSWNRLIPLLSQDHECIPADLPSFGDSGILAAPATTANAARVFHEFVTGIGAPPTPFM